MSFTRLLVALLILLTDPLHADDPARVTVDCTKAIGAIRPLHGVNHGPIDGGGLVDLSKYYREAKFPYVRLHDVHWPNADVVDMHVVFPNPDADPEKPESYDFGATDDFIRAIDKTGGKVVYRLGEAIEHTPRKRFVHPPKDIDRWAAAAVGIVRHYEEGFANGPKIKIPYWEIWNEPENQPACWTGTNEQYFELYAATARAIKARFPNVKVGGPAVGNPGSLKPDGSFVPSKFCADFVAFCQKEKLPLDFFSWHVYTNDPTEPAARARAIRKLLDAHGFQATESHLNEWNYLPGNDWGPVLLQGQGEPRRRFLDRMHGAEGASFTAATLIELLDAPVDVANYYTANTGGFGLFDESGVPKKSYFALAAFGDFADGGADRLGVSVEGVDGLRAVASRTAEGGVEVLLVWTGVAADKEQAINVRLKLHPWGPWTRIDTWTLDATHNLHRGPGGISHDTAVGQVSLRGPSVVLMKFSGPPKVGGPLKRP